MKFSSVLKSKRDKNGKIINNSTTSGEIMKNKKTLSIQEVESEISNLRAKFRDDISDIASKCEKNITVEISLREHNHFFMHKTKGTFPFVISITPIYKKSEETWFGINH